MQLHNATAQCNCTMQLHNATALCNCTMQLHYATAQCNCSRSILSSNTRICTPRLVYRRVQRCGFHACPYEVEQKNNLLTIHTWYSCGYIGVDPMCAPMKSNKKIVYTHTYTLHTWFSCGYRGAGPMRTAPWAPMRAGDRSALEGRRPRFTRWYRPCMFVREVCVRVCACACVRVCVCVRV